MGGKNSKEHRYTIDAVQRRQYRRYSNHEVFPSYDDEEPCYRDNDRCQEIPDPPRDIALDEDSIWVPLSDAKLQCHGYYEGPKKASSPRELPNQEWVWKETVLMGLEVPRQNVDYVSDDYQHYLYLDCDSTKTVSGADKYSVMVTIFKPLIVANVDVKRLLPYLDFIDCEGVRIAERRDKRSAVSFLLDEIEISTEPGKWNRFLHALEDNGYSYVVDNLKGNDVIDHTYQKKYVGIIAQSLRQVIDPSELLAHLRSTGVINGQDVQEIDSYQRHYGMIGAADKLLERIHKMHQFWYILFIEALTNARMTEAVDMLDIPELTCNGKAKEDDTFRPIDDSQTFVKVARMHVEKDNYYEPIPRILNNDETAVKSLKTNTHYNPDVTRLKQVASGERENINKEELTHRSEVTKLQTPAISSTDMLKQTGCGLAYLQPEAASSWKSLSTQSIYSGSGNQSDYVDDLYDEVNNLTDYITEIQKIAKLPPLPSVPVQNTQPKQLLYEEIKADKQYVPKPPVVTPRETDTESLVLPLPLRDYPITVIYKPPVPLPRGTLERKMKTTKRKVLATENTHGELEETLEHCYMAPEPEKGMSDRHITLEENKHLDKVNIFPQSNQFSSDRNLYKSASDSNLHTLRNETASSVFDADKRNAAEQFCKQKIGTDHLNITKCSDVKRQAVHTSHDVTETSARNQPGLEEVQLPSTEFNVGHVNKMTKTQLVQIHSALKDDLTQTEEKLPILVEMLNIKKEKRDRLLEMRSVVQEYKTFHIQCAALERAMEKDDLDTLEDDAFSYNPPDAICMRRKAFRRQRNVSESSDQNPNDDVTCAPDRVPSFRDKQEVDASTISGGLFAGHRKIDGVPLVPCTQDTGKQLSDVNTYNDSAFYSEGSVSTKL